jgi:hypothetical protein
VVVKTETEGDDWTQEYRPLGSSRGKSPDHGQPAAVLALVKDKPSATLKESRPWPSLCATATVICGRDGRMLAARVEQRMKQQSTTKMAWCTLDKESPIQAVCGKAARTVLGGGRAWNARPYRYFNPIPPVTRQLQAFPDGCYLSAMAPVSTNALSWLGESGYALALF